MSNTECIGLDRKLSTHSYDVNLSQQLTSIKYSRAVGRASSLKITGISEGISFPFTSSNNGDRDSVKLICNRKDLRSAYVTQYLTVKASVTMDRLGNVLALLG
jgi:hypothetical protein